jgi:DNA adenine methylase
MRKLSQDHIVLISEQTAPDDFEAIWEQELIRQLDVNKNNNFKVTEKLFKWKG